MNGNYLIPANAKRGGLIFGAFKPIDLIIFGTGSLITLLLLIFLPLDKLGTALLAIAPAGITGLLVLPVAHYHNVRQLLIEIYKYFTNRNKFVWKGWCFINETSEDTAK